MSKNLRFSDSFPVLLVPRTLETAQNRKVWAARAKPVSPANDIFNFIDILKTANICGLFCGVERPFDEGYASDGPPLVCDYRSTLLQRF